MQSFRLEKLSKTEPNPAPALHMSPSATCTSLLNPYRDGDRNNHTWTPLVKIKLSLKTIFSDNDNQSTDFLEMIREETANKFHYCSRRLDTKNRGNDLKIPQSYHKLKDKILQCSWVWCGSSGSSPSSSGSLGLQNDQECHRVTEHFGKDLKDHLNLHRDIYGWNWM